jgi:hypothetical protein
MFRFDISTGNPFRLLGVLSFSSSVCCWCGGDPLILPANRASSSVVAAESFGMIVLGRLRFDDAGTVDEI